MLCIAKLKLGDGALLWHAIFCNDIGSQSHSFLLLWHLFVTRSDLMPLQNNQFNPTIRQCIDREQIDITDINAMPVCEVVVS